MVYIYLENEDRIKSDNYIGKSTIPGADIGVFAGRNYKKGEVVEVNRYLLGKNIGKDEPIKNYMFGINGKSIIPIGNINLINHQDNSFFNVDWTNYSIHGDYFYVWANRDFTAWRGIN